jgi:hypothetical protein
MPSLDAGANIHLPFPHTDWVITALPFAPLAINDAGLIVGNLNGQAVQFQNGTLQVLPEDSEAVDVSSLGAIVGFVGGGAGLVFPLPLVLPDPPSGVFEPAAINKHLAVVGTSGDAEQAFKWTPSAGWEALQPPHRFSGELPAFAEDINDAGFAVGSVSFGLGEESKPVLWTPDHHAAFHWPGISVGRREMHINNHGDTVIFDADAARNVSVLHLDGTVDSFPSIPELLLSVDGISDEGRIIGTSQVNGVPRAWTFYKNQLHWLDLPDGTPFQPTGVNSCGNIVGSGAHSGFLFARPLPSRCDGAGVIKHL